MSDDHTPRKRAPNEAYAFARNARQFVNPFQLRLSAWTQELARLRAMSMLRGERPSRELIDRLRREAVAAHAEFLADVGTQPTSVACHSITRDLDRAFHRLVDQLADVTGTPPPSLQRDLLGPDIHHRGP